MFGKRLAARLAISDRLRMHGIIVLELKKFVETRLGHDAWTDLLVGAGVPAKVYLPVQEYPDAEVVSLVTIASKTTGLPVAAILADFGEFIVPDLVTVYRSLINNTWKTLDLIENTEKMIHKVVRIKNPGARPPELQVTRPSREQVVIVYRSERRMCALAVGIVRGIAKHYGEVVDISEPSCMLSGADHCKIVVDKR